VGAVEAIPRGQRLNPGWSPPKDWNKGLVDSTNIDLGYSKDKRRSQSLQVKFRERIMQWLND
jgi:hypothetical protein